MRVIIQRVLKADCIVNKEIVSSIHHGMMILVGFTHTDSEKEIEQMKTSWHCQIKQTHSKCLKCC